MRKCRSFVPLHHVRQQFRLRQIPARCGATAAVRRSVENPRVLLLPAYRIVVLFILLVKPGLQRREIIRNRRRVHLLLAGQRRQRILPRLARAQRQHFVQPSPASLLLINRAAMQRPGVSSLPAQAPAETETAKCAPENSACKARSPGHEISRPDQSPLPSAPPAAQRPDTSSRKSHHSLLY